MGVEGVGEGEVVRREGLEVVGGGEGAGCVEKGLVMCWTI